MFNLLLETSLHVINLVFRWGMNIHNNDRTPTTSYYYVSYPMSNSLNPRNCWILFSYAQNNLYQVNGSHSIFRRRVCMYSPAGLMPLPSHVISCTPINLTHTCIVLLPDPCLPLIIDGFPFGYPATILCILLLPYSH